MSFSPALVYDFVLLAAAQNLDRAVNYAVTANDAVRLAVAGLLGQVLAVGLKELAAGSLFLLPVWLWCAPE